jgi:6-phospho-3-hexuloisomerase
VSSNNHFTELANTLQQELLQVTSEIDVREVQRFIHELLTARRIFISGKGRTGLQMRSFAMRLMHLDLQVHVVDDVTTPGIQDGDLLVIGTASGKTPSLVAYADIAVQVGAKIISITSTTDNPISEQSAVNIVIPAPSHKNNSNAQSISSVQPLGGLFELALGFLLNLLVIELVEELGVDESEMIIRHANLE